MQVKPWMWATAGGIGAALAAKKAEEMVGLPDWVSVPTSALAGVAAGRGIHGLMTGLPGVVSRPLLPVHVTGSQGQQAAYGVSKGNYNATPRPIDQEAFYREASRQTGYKPGPMGQWERSLIPDQWPTPAQGRTTTEVVQNIQNSLGSTNMQPMQKALPQAREDIKIPGMGHRAPANIHGIVNTPYTEDLYMLQTKGIDPSSVARDVINQTSLLPSTVSVSRSRIAGGTPGIIHPSGQERQLRRQQRLNEEEARRAKRGNQPQFMGIEDEIAAYGGGF